MLHGLANFELKNYEVAIQSYLEAIRINTNDASLHYNLGNAYQKTGDSDSAVLAYKQALMLNPSHSKAHTSLGNAYFSQEKFSDALDCYEKAIAPVHLQRRVHLL